jgi:tyrosinase
MADANDDDPVVPNPTYMEHIRFFFRPVDIDHMRRLGPTQPNPYVDLGSYEAVKKAAYLIHFHTAPPIADMPPGAPWSPNRVQTFTNWVVNGYPRGAATPQAVTQRLTAAAPDRLRKNVNSLSEPEQQTLAKAFSGIMAKSASDPQSYLALAGLHGIPQSYCEHHDDPFNPWHRVYLKNFEDALRSVDGCGDVTLPYWDITEPLPALLQQAPFDEYTLPQSVWPGTAPSPDPYANLTTSRYGSAAIATNFQNRGVWTENSDSLKESLWGESGVNGFQSLSIQAHDGGHTSIGPTMADQNVASYDPVFWFYHCNIDRYFWAWQTLLGATTTTGFESTLGGNIGFLAPPFNILTPWTTTIQDSLDLGVGYEELPKPDGEVVLRNTVGSVEAGRSFRINSSSPVSVRVKDIARLGIPGSFDVHLLADGEVIATRGFFQATRPNECENCVKKPLININFRLDQDQILDRKLSVEIEPLAGFEGIGDRIPLSAVGNPTVNARLLLEDE